jgi:hypothetical protein
MRAAAINRTSTSAAITKGAEGIPEPAARAKTAFAVSSAGAIGPASAPLA